MKLRLAAVADALLCVLGMALVYGSQPDTYERGIGVGLIVVTIVACVPLATLGLDRLPSGHS